MRQRNQIKQLIINLALILNVNMDSHPGSRNRHNHEKARVLHPLAQAD